MGRPSLYTENLATEICERLASGESLNAICADEHMPAESRVREWAIMDREGFSAKYARAREIQAHHMAETALREAVAATDPQLGRLAFDARRWFTGKTLPRVYGDKVQNTHEGPDGGPVQIAVRKFFSPPGETK